MRKFSAIVLMLVFLLYHLGYYGIYFSSRYQLEKAWEDKIENNRLSSKDLLEASFPISFPYRPDELNFRPVSGMVEIEGKFYRMLKQRYAKDTLHILYVNDTALEDLHQSFQEWVASLTQEPVSGNGSMQLCKSVAKDFLLYTLPSMMPMPTDDTTQFGHYISLQYEVFPMIPSPPPKL